MAASSASPPRRLVVVPYQTDAQPQRRDHATDRGHEQDHRVDQQGHGEGRVAVDAEDRSRSDTRSARTSRDSPAPRHDRRERHATRQQRGLGASARSRAPGRPRMNVAIEKVQAAALKTARAASRRGSLDDRQAVPQAPRQVEDRGIPFGQGGDAVGARQPMAQDGHDQTRRAGARRSPAPRTTAVDITPPTPRTTTAIAASPTTMTVSTMRSTTTVPSTVVPAHALAFAERVGVARARRVAPAGRCWRGSRCRCSRARGDSARA